MAIPDGACRVVYSGNIAGGAEKWAFGLWFSPLGAGFDFSGGEPSDAGYLGFRAAFLPFLTASDAYTQIDSWIYHGGIATVHTNAVFNHPGTAGGSSVQAPQVALVLTLRTATATKSGRGRIYIPARAVTMVTATGLANTTAINTLVDALATYFTNLNAFSTPIIPAVVSQTQGVARPIVSVDADGVLDTQRRRRNKLTGPRHSHTV